MKATKLTTGIVAGLLTASLAVAPQATAETTDNGGSSDNINISEALGKLSSKDGEGDANNGEGSSNAGDGEGSSLDDKQKKILGGVLGGIAGLALLAALFNVVKSGKLPVNIPL